MITESILQLSGNPFEVIVGKQYVYSLYDHSPKHTCLDQVAINNLDTLRGHYDAWYYLQECLLRPLNHGIRIQQL
jgi:hypothetical protein